MPGAAAPEVAGGGAGEADAVGQQATGGGPGETASPAATAVGPPGRLLSTVGEAWGVTKVEAAWAAVDDWPTDAGRCD